MVIPMQTAGILPGWMVGVPLLIVVGLFVWLLIKGNRDEPVQFTDDEGWEFTPEPVTTEVWPPAGTVDCEPVFSTDLKRDMLHNREASAEDVREAVIALWNECNGWIPGAAYKDLAYVLGVDVDRLTHYDPMLRQHHKGTP